MRKCLPQSKFKRGTNVQVRISMDGKQRKQGEAKLTTGGEEKRSQTTGSVFVENETGQ